MDIRVDLFSIRQRERSSVAANKEESFLQTKLFLSGHEEKCWRT